MEQSAWPDVFPDSSRQRLTSHQSTDALSFKPTSHVHVTRQQYKESATSSSSSLQGCPGCSHRRLLWNGDLIINQTTKAVRLERHRCAVTAGGFSRSNGSAYCLLLLQFFFSS
jgi:hypothetical protein